MDVRLERRWGVGKTERHHKVLEMAVLCLESYLLLISLLDSEPVKAVIGVAEVKFSKDLSLRKAV
jgi:hypothetical protein